MSDAEALQKARENMIKKRFGGNKEGSEKAGKGSSRRKKKVVHKTAGEDSKKLDAQLKKMTLQPIPQIDEANFICEDGKVYNFPKPKVQANLQSQTFVVSSPHDPQVKTLEECGPDILPQLGPEYLKTLQEFAKSYQEQQAQKASSGLPDVTEGTEEEDDEDDEAPELEEVEDNVD